MSATQDSDVLIVGGGLFGCFTGFFLARQGLRVQIVERGLIGAQASATNFGALRLHGRSAVQYPLSLRAQTLWEQFRELTGEDCEIERTGHLYIARSEDGFAQICNDAQIAQRFGVTSEVLAQDALRRRFPLFSDRVLGASFSPRSAVANPRLSTLPLARAILRMGGRVIENCEVAQARREVGGFVVTATDDRRFAAPRLVNAAGAWSGMLAAAFGEAVPMFSAGPPQFVTEPLRHRLMPSVHMIEGDVIVRQIARGNVIFSGYPRTRSIAGGDRTFVPPAKTRHGMQALVSAIPMLAHADIIRVWSGVEGYLPDMLPVIGPSATIEGLFHAFGGSGGGFQIAPGVGDWLAGAILGGAAPEGAAPGALAPYRISRFLEAPEVSDKIGREFDRA